MKDKLFFIGLFLLAILYVGNDVVKSGKLENILNGSTLHDLYSHYAQQWQQNEYESDAQRPTQKQNISFDKASKNDSGLTVEHFQQHITKPRWFNSVNAPTATSSEDVTTIWQSKKRCCESKSVLQENNREFYKTCYQEIENHFSNEELVVKCLWLMDSGTSREQSKSIKHYLINHFSHHKRDISRCSNCAPADTVARVSLELARMEWSEGAHLNAIQLLETVLDQRQDEISPWVETEIYTALARWYSDDRLKRRDRLSTALKRLEDQSRFLGNGIERRLPKLKKNIDHFMDQ